MAACTPGPVWIFLRHGQCAGNVARVLVAPPDSPLTEVGRAQAAAAAEALRTEPIVQVLSSPMLRARQTADIVRSVHPRASLEVVPSLSERSFGALDGSPMDDVKAGPWAHTRAAWNRAAPGGETLEMVAARATHALRTRCIPGTTLVVAHAGVIRALVGLLDGRPRERIGRIRVPHCTPWVRQVTPGRWKRLGV